MVKKKKEPEFARVVYKSDNSIVFEIGTRKVKIDGANDYKKITGLKHIDYGVSVLPFAVWQAIKNKYGKMKIFTNNVIYAE